MSVRWVLVAMVAVGCGDDGELEGHCETYEQPTGLNCDTIELCCAADDSTCWYEANGTQYECASPFDCDAAAFAVVCDACTIGEGETETSACVF